MELLNQLRAEHDLIEQVAGSLRAFVRARARGEGQAADGVKFMQFFRLYAGRFHHAREEDTLFVSLQRDAELPGHRGPIAAITRDHHRMAGILDAMEPLMTSAHLDEEALGRLTALGLQYAEQLWHHIDAENSVLFPESEERLRRRGIRELPAREMFPDEAEARETGLRLLGRYPPESEPDVIRGDGCVMCPAFLEDCRGIEHEWWNEWEWDEFEDHLPSG